MSSGCIIGLVFAGVSVLYCGVRLYIDEGCELNDICSRTHCCGYTMPSCCSLKVKTITTQPQSKISEKNAEINFENFNKIQFVKEGAECAECTEEITDI
jgi:hypothetical protein